MQIIIIIISVVINVIIFFLLALQWIKDKSRALLNEDLNIPT